MTPFDPDAFTYATCRHCELAVPILDNSPVDVDLNRGRIVPHRCHGGELLDAELRRAFRESVMQAGELLKVEILIGQDAIDAMLDRLESLDVPYPWPP